MSKLLKPCPFCGEPYRLYVGCSDTDPVTKGIHFDDPVAIVLCGYCCASAGFVKIGGKHTREEAVEGAIKYWNQRVTEEASE